MIYLRLEVVFGLLISCQAIKKAQEAGCKVDSFANAKSNPHKLPEAPPACFAGVDESFNQSSLWSTLRYYANTTDFRNYTAYDFYPERFQDYTPSYQHFFRHDSHVGPEHSTDVRLMTCATNNTDGSKWAVQKLGPFISTGGYDWWQFSWNDVGRLSHVLKENPLGVYILESSIRAVDTKGVPLGFPPIHNHHTHVTREGQSYKYRKHYKAHTHLPFEWFYEAHGDYQCRDQEGGVGCYIDGFEGHGKMVDYLMHIEGEVNDVRAVGSPPMEWFIEISFRWIPIASEQARDVKPESVHVFFSLGNMDLEASQQNQVTTFDLKTDGAPYMYWFYGKMGTSGDMLRNKLHAHSHGFESAFFFTATPEDLGLQHSHFKPEIVPSGSFHLNRGTALKAAGFETQAQFRDYLFQKFNEAVQTYDAVCTNGAHSDPRCLRPRPALICEGWPDKEEVQGQLFDRRPPTCCNDWSFKEGDPYITVGIYAYDGLPSAALGDPVIPEYYPEHLTWMMRYTPDEWRGSVSGSYGAGGSGYSTDSWTSTKTGCIKDRNGELLQGLMRWLTNTCPTTDSKQLPHRTGNRTSFLQWSETHAEMDSEMMTPHVEAITPLFAIAAIVCLCAFCREKQSPQEAPCIKMPKHFQWVYRSVYVQAGIGESNRKEPSYQTCQRAAKDV
jgi:hypothetical protein